MIQIGKLWSLKHTKRNKMIYVHVLGNCLEALALRRYKMRCFQLYASNGSKSRFKEVDTSNNEIVDMWLAHR